MSNEELFLNIYEAIVFDQDEQEAIKLLKKGLSEGTIDINKKDEEGNTLLYHAEFCGLDDVESLLKEHGAVSD